MTSSTSATHRTMSVEEFLAWERSDNQRYELIEGVPLAMTPPRRSHGTIVFNLARGIAEALARKPPCVGVVEAGIRSTSREQTYYQADLAITCAKAEPGQQETREPLIIIEVTSPSTAAHDRRVKLVDYRKIPSVEEILLIDQERHYCEVHRRLEGERWLVDLIVDLGASVRLESIDVDLELSRIYAGVEVVQKD